MNLTFRRAQWLDLARFYARHAIEVRAQIAELLRSTDDSYAVGIADDLIELPQLPRRYARRTRSN